jgi:hypothetical protein
MADTGEEPGFVPITPNPFIVGNPVRDRSMFFGREAEFDLVRRRFHPPASGGLLVFSGDRRSGKTSILFQILDGRLGPEFLPALVDMQSMAIENDTDFLAKVASEILDALGPERTRLAPPVFRHGSTPSTAFLAFMGELRLLFPGRTPVLLVDEYELLGSKIESGRLTVDVLHMMASLMEIHSVCIVFTGSQHIEQRCQDYWRILGKSVFRVISYLQREDAIRLMQRPVEGRVRYGEGTLEQIYRLTAGQPFYTQAVCQNLVDHLNERRVSHADRDTVETVVAEIVDNPFPQMIFLWDGLARDEKISLALLAGRLTGPEDRVRVADLLAALKEGHYSLRLSEARLSTALEGLFKKDFLLKDSEARPGYAFRMDLWRLWVRRMHSLWQVMREEGMQIRRDPHRGRRRAAVLSAGLLVLVPLSLVLLRGRPAPPGDAREAGIPAYHPGEAEVRLEVVPSRAAILAEGGALVGLGAYRGIVQGGREHTFRFRASGYVETTLTVEAPAGTTVSRTVSLRPQRGSLRVETDPPGARITVDGRPVGRSPLLVPGLEVPRVHRVAAALQGRTPAQKECAVAADSVMRIALDLPPPRVTLLLETSPSRAEIRLDGNLRGTSPLVLDNLAAGRVRLTARRDGYRLADTSLELHEGSQEIQLPLRREPPAVFMAQGDEPATIYIDGELVKENVQNSGERELAAGIHRIQIRRIAGGVFEDTIRVRSGELVLYDFTQRKVLRRTSRGGSGNAR